MKLFLTRQKNGTFSLCDQDENGDCHIWKEIDSREFERAFTFYSRCATAEVKKVADGGETEELYEIIILPSKQTTQP